MKKILERSGKRPWLLVLTFFVGLAGMVIWATSPKAQAGCADCGPYYRVRLASSSSSATADGKDTINFTVTTFLYRCNQDRTLAGKTYPRYEESPGSCDAYGGIKGEEIKDGIRVSISATGSDARLSTATLYTDSNGRGSFTLKSGVAGSKTVKAEVVGSASKTVTFTVPEPDPPATPTISEVKVGTQVVEAGQTPSLKPDQRLTLTGKTVAKGVIKLIIFSDPREETVSADDQGNWSHNISGLEAGEHRVEAEVTDPATGKTSARQELLKFTVLAAQTVAAEPDEAVDKESGGWPIWIWPIIGGGIVLLGTSSYFGWRWWRQRKPKAPRGKPAIPDSPDDVKTDKQ